MSSRMVMKVRSLLLRSLASILTLALTLLYPLLTLLALLPLPSTCHLHHTFRHSLHTLAPRVSPSPRQTLQNNLFLILNSTLSLLSVLIVANYCETMLAVVEWTSRQTHAGFLRVLLPGLKRGLESYTPAWVVDVYILLGYVGLTSQLALTLDLIYLYNLPTIYMYKLLTYSYSRLLNTLTLSLQVLTHSPEKWLTCPYPILARLPPQTNKLIALGTAIVLGQILAVVGFYYLWLASVILGVVLVMNAVRNGIEGVKGCGELLMVLKGFGTATADQDGEGFMMRNYSFRDKARQVMAIKVSWVPLIRLQDIRDVFLGKDIIRLAPAPHWHTGLHFSIEQTYKSFLRLAHIG